MQKQNRRLALPSPAKGQRTETVRIWQNEANLARRGRRIGGQLERGLSSAAVSAQNPGRNEMAVRSWCGGKLISWRGACWSARSAPRSDLARSGKKLQTKGPCPLLTQAV